MHLLRPFDERELELIICGISNIDVNDWRTHTRLKQCTPETSQVAWFWLVSSNFNDPQQLLNRPMILNQFVLFSVLDRGIVFTGDAG